MTKQKKQSISLNEIGVKHGTDKSDLLHGYLEEYEKLFPNPDSVEKVVELGLQRRSGKWKESSMPSVRMWLEFFPNAHVFGFDMQNLDSFERFTFFRGEQGRCKHHVEFGKLCGWDLDLVVDDCSHRPTDSLLSLLFFWPRLKKGGVYIVEDVQAVVQQDYPEWMRTENYFPQYLKTLGAKIKWVASKSAGPKSSLILIKK